jgi:serine/threonine protein phosphatase PrpC
MEDSDSKIDLISIEPEVTEIFLDPSKDEFILMACDGLFDVMTG